MDMGDQLRTGDLPPPAPLEDAAKRAYEAAYDEFCGDRSDGSSTTVFSGSL